MKILHIYKTFIGDSFGGVEQVILQMAKTDNLSFNHTVLSLSKKNHAKETYPAGIKTICYHQDFSIASSGFSASLLKDFGTIIKEFDLLHYHFPWPFADFLHLLWQVKKPALLTYHSDIIRQKKLQFFYAPLMHRFLAKMNTIVATSPNYLATSPVLQKYKDKVAIIPLGINKDLYPKPTEIQKAYWQQRFGPRFFLFIGVMRYYKGLDILLDAIHNTNFPVLIVGSGPLETELKEKAKKLQLNQVHFLGQVTEVDKIALLHSCLAILFPSHLRSEAFGISLLEGAMLGKPLISCEIGTGTSYVNIHGQTGLVVPPSDAKALRQAMEFIWDNPQESALMGLKAAARYQALFTADQMIAQYEKIYQRLGSEKNTKLI